MKLLTYSSSKIDKSNNAGLGYLTAIMYLAPYDLSGHIVCSDATTGCINACLNTAGRGRFDNVQQARIARTQWFYNDKHAFMAQLVKEISAHVRKAGRLGLKPVVRLNGTSDIPWEKIKMVSGMSPMVLFPDITFYDYTKSFRRMTATLPRNYTLTFSRSENTTSDQIEAILNAGKNVAAVFHDVPMFWDERQTSESAFPVIDGDKHDMRFLDPAGVIVGLKAKGKAKHDTSGFVV